MQSPTLGAYRAVRAYEEWLTKQKGLALKETNNDRRVKVFVSHDVEDALLAEAFAEQP